MKSQTGIDGPHPHVFVIATGPDLFYVAKSSGLVKASQFDRSTEALSSVRGKN